MGDLGSVSELGRSPGGGNGNPLQYSCLKNPVDKGSWWIIELDMSERLTQRYWNHISVIIICNYIRNQYQKIFENNPHIFKSNVTFTKRLWHLKQSAHSCTGSCCSWTPIRFLRCRPRLSLCDPITEELWEETSAGFLCKNWFHVTFVCFFWSLLAQGWILA